jgi:predicted RNA binding protein YcfA (HicA-like mRNA interferase family)
MPRPIPLKIVVKVLKEKGFFFVSQKGSHGKFRKPGNPTITVIVKMGKKEVPHGTFQSILLQSGLKECDFRDRQKQLNFAHS